MNVADMGAAMRARDAGMQSSVNHAEDDAPGWQDRAYSLIHRLAGLITAPEWTMEQMRSTCYACGLDKPAEERAFGSVTAKLIKDGVIEPVGFARAASSNSSFKRTYRLVRPVDATVTKALDAKQK